MPTYTTTYSLGKPVVGADEDAWGDTLNASLDSIDDILDGTTPVTGIDINSGTLDGVTIGGTTAGAGTFTTLTANTSITGTLATAAQPNITSVGSLTSLDVAGTITSDGLTVTNTADTPALTIQGNNDTSGTKTTLRFHDTDTTSTNGQQLGKIEFYSTDVGNSFGPAVYAEIDVKATSSQPGSEFTFKTVDIAGTAIRDRLVIGDEGDISFYEDTGTTAKFFWDASAENLLLGTTTAAGVTDGLTIYKSAGTAGININANIYGADYSILSGATGADKFGIYDNDAAAYRMVIDNGGNVGIGTSSPADPLHVSSSTNLVRFQSTTNGLYNTYISTAGTFGYVGSGSQTVSGGATTDFGIQAALGGFIVATGGNTERMRIDSSGNVGIGTSSPVANHRLTLDNAGFVQALLSTSGTARLSLYGDSAVSAVDAKTNPLAFYAGSSERMRIDSSGNLLVGTTSTNLAFSSSNTGSAQYADGSHAHSRDGGIAGYYNRLTSDGKILNFAKDGTTVGSIESDGGSNLVVKGAGNNAALLFNHTNSRIEPYVDNVTDLGRSLVRFDDIYATNGTIQTSDQNEKQDIAELSDAEQRVAVAAKGLLRKFRWRDAVEEKGDEARTHFGIIAQDLQAAFEAEGLDAGDYAMFIHSTWTDEETGEERSRMGVRYSELLAFIIAAI